MLLCMLPLILAFTAFLSIILSLSNHLPSITFILFHSSQSHLLHIAFKKDVTGTVVIFSTVTLLLLTTTFIETIIQLFVQNEGILCYLTLVCLHYLPWAAVTRYHQLGGLKQ